MPSTPTPILSLTVPTVGGDSNTWGTEVNGNWQIIDNLGAAPTTVVNSTPYAATFNQFPESVFRVTTGASNLVFNLPSPTLCYGKIFTVKKLDLSAGIVQIMGSIDGFTEWDLTNQYQYVRLYSNGVSFDVIGNN
jgi:hypothetical protein